MTDAHDRPNGDGTGRQNGGPAVAGPNGGPKNGRGAGGPAGALHAPHRRSAGAPRQLEKAAVLGYRAAEWTLAHLPPRLAWTVGAWVTQASYLAWPKKRRWVNENFAHVLGTEPSDPRVRSLALAAYRS